MGLDITTEYPSWLILLCLVVGLVYSLLLYYRNKKSTDLGKSLLWSLSIARFIVVSFLCYLLLSPLLKSILKEVEKPVIVIAQDDSESLIAGKDSSYLKSTYVQSLQHLHDKLSERYEVAFYSFGDKVKRHEKNVFDSVGQWYHQKQTDFSLLFKEIENRYSNRNLGAVVVASDGLYNKGTSPVYASDRIKARVYTIALGDTTPKKDAIIIKAEYNRLAYLVNNFPLRIYVEGRDVKGSKALLTVTKDGNEVGKKEWEYTADNFSITADFTLEAKQTGIQKYRVSLSKAEGEKNLNNNFADIFIEVMDAREKILILADIPHPDIAALSAAINTKENYEVEYSLIANFNASVKPYSLLILHQPSSVSPAWKRVLQEIDGSKIPALIIGGDLSVLNSGLMVISGNNRSNDCEAVLQNNFSSFTVSDELKKFIKNFPAVQCAFGNYRLSNGANVMLHQKIGLVETQNPLLFFNQVQDRKTGVFCGEGLWKWRMRDYAAHANHQLFDELITKTVQYLAVKADKSFFRVNSKTAYTENESIEFDAEVYNESYELITEPEVSLTIIDSENKKYPFTFSKTATSYRLLAGQMPPGEYQWEAQSKAGTKVLTQKGYFSVSQMKVEQVNTVANHAVLYDLARQRGGQLYNTNQLQQLEELLSNREDIKPISYTQKRYSDMVNLKGLFFVLLALLSMEWFLRKRNGLY